MRNGELESIVAWIGDANGRALPSSEPSMRRKFMGRVRSWDTFLEKDFEN